MQVFGDREAVVYGERSYNYERVRRSEVIRVARALLANGIEPGDRVAYLIPNLPEMLIAHFAVPLIGAVLVAINTRLSAPEIEYILDHSGASLLVVDAALLEALADFKAPPAVRRTVVLVDGDGPVPPAHRLLHRLCREGSDEPLPWRVDDEHRPISINYTSGTTGRPKGVQYTHRGAYLNALAELLHSRHSPDSVYLWTLADVPLQRLVHHLGDHRDRRHQHLPAGGRPGDGLGADRQRAGHPPQRAPRPS